MMPVAVVTGSSSGIGLATATSLAQRGYSVVLHGHRRLDKLESAASILKKHLSADAQLRCIAADISCQAACQRLVQTCYYWHPQIDLWVNNAGADVLTGSLRQASFEEKLNRLWQVDVLGTIRLSKMVAERMAAYHQPPCASPPSIINIGWDQATLGMEGEPGQLFCTVKSAVLAFTSALSLTMAPRVRVNAVSPGWIKTAWGQKFASDPWNRRAIAECQLERWGQPDDVAEAICWLASPAANFINGQNLIVNGGRRFYQPPASS